MPSKTNKANAFNGINAAMGANPTSHPFAWLFSEHSQRKDKKNTKTKIKDEERKNKRLK
jgi:hypothetical protein